MTAEPRVTAAPLTIPNLDADVDNLTAALAYAECGWYLGAGPVRHETPRLRGRQRLAVGPRRDPDQIAAWFAGTDHGIALHAGRSGAVIVDMDHPEKTPADVLEALQQSWAPFQSSRVDADGQRPLSVRAAAGPHPRQQRRPVPRLRFRGARQQRGDHRRPEPPQGGRRGRPVRLGADRAGAGAARPHRRRPARRHRGHRVGHRRAGSPRSCRPTPTRPRPAILHGWRKALQGHFETGSRHDGAVTVTAGAMKEARAGYFPAGEAVDLLRAMFITAATRPPTGGERQRAEKTARARV